MIDYDKFEKSLKHLELQNNNLQMKAVLALMPAFVPDAIGLYQTKTERIWD